MTFDLARLRTIAKALVAAAGTGLLASPSALIFIPDHVDAPWWSYPLCGLLSAVVVGYATYRVPNAPPASSGL